MAHIMGYMETLNAFSSLACCNICVMLYALSTQYTQHSAMLYIGLMLCNFCYAVCTMLSHSIPRQILNNKYSNPHKHRYQNIVDL